MPVERATCWPRNKARAVSDVFWMSGCGGGLRSLSVSQGLANVDVISKRGPWPVFGDLSAVVDEESRCGPGEGEINCRAGPASIHATGCPAGTTPCSTGCRRYWSEYFSSV